MPQGRELDHNIGGKLHDLGPDAVIGALGERQHGVVARRQLLDAGIGRRAVDHRLACGRLRAVHRGVYAVGHRVLSRDGRWTAALLAVGPDAVLSHRSAAALWRIRPSTRLDVTVPRALPRRPGVQLHRSARFADEVAVVRGMAVTTPTRTLLDLAAAVSRQELEKALNEAEVLRLTDEVPLGALVDRHPTLPGTSALRAILADHARGTTITRSELEDRFLAFVEAAGLPRPRVNALTLDDQTLEVDCLWRDQSLIAELDGRATHGTRHAFERDRARDRMLQARGWRVVRITWRALHDRPHALSAELARLLGAQLP